MRMDMDRANGHGQGRGEADLYRLEQDPGVDVPQHRLQHHKERHQSLAEWHQKRKAKASVVDRIPAEAQGKGISR